MTDRETALQGLAKCIEDDDTASAHTEADAILCRLLISLGYQDVVDQYLEVSKWYE